VLAKPGTEALLLVVGERPAEAVRAQDGGQEQESREGEPDEGRVQDVDPFGAASEHGRRGSESLEAALK
jgi:hypothetical protein